MISPATATQGRGTSQSPTPPLTLAIVVNFNDKKNAARTVLSLENQARVVVWDNGSTDGSVDTLRHAGFTVHASPENILWTPALNRAVEQYWDGEPYILFSNNDIRYEPNCVQVLEQACEYPVGIVAPTGSGMGGRQSFAHFYGAEAQQYGWGRSFKEPLKQFIAGLPTIKVNYVVGAAMMVSKRLWDEIGPLDETMPLGADDHDYCIRAKQVGYTVAVAYSAFVWHDPHSSFQHSKPIWDEWGGKSWKAFNEKWAGYYFNEEEAVKCHWEATATPGWDVGTGWMTKEERDAIWAKR